MACALIIQPKVLLLDDSLWILALWILEPFLRTTTTREELKRLRRELPLFIPRHRQS